MKDIYINKDNNFKTNTLSINFTKNYEVDDQAKVLLFNNCLFEETKKYKTITDINEEAIKNGIIHYDSIFNKIGDNLIFCFKLDYLNEKFRNNVKFINIMEFIKEISTSLIITKEIFEKRKEQLLITIKEEKLTPQTKAILFFEKNFYNDYMKVGNFCFLEDIIKKITYQDILDFYSKLQTSYKNILIVGDDNIETLQTLIQNNKEEIKIIKIKNDCKYNEKLFVHNIESEETMIYFGYQIVDGLSKKDLAILNVYNSMLGGGTSSKLFMEIREKESLTYHIRSTYDSSDNTLIIYATVSNEDKDIDKTIYKIQEIVEKFNINEEELKEKIEKLITVYKAETVNAKHNDLRNKYLLDNMTSQEYIDSFKSLTTDDVNKFSQRLKLKVIEVTTGGTYGK